MGKSSSRSRALGTRTSVLVILGVNPVARTVLFQQNGQLFTARQSLGWTPAHQNPPLTLNGTVPSHPGVGRGTELALQRVIDPPAPFQVQFKEAISRGRFSSPRGQRLRLQFPTTADMRSSYDIPGDMARSLERWMGPLPTLQPLAAQK